MGKSRAGSRLFADAELREKQVEHVLHAGPAGDPADGIASPAELLCDQLRRRGVFRVRQGFASRGKRLAMPGPGDQRGLAAPGLEQRRGAGFEQARRLGALAATVKGKAAKAAWANELLPLFAGKETLTIRGKAAIDPVVLELCKLAGREPPAVEATK
jgi:hypothetical protein